MKNFVYLALFNFKTKQAQLFIKNSMPDLAQLFCIPTCHLSDQEDGLDK